MNMKNTYVECLNWTWPEKLLYIKECIGDDVPHKKLCGHGVMDKAEILNGYITAKYLYCDSEGMMSYDDESVDRPIRFNYKKLTLSDLKPKSKQFISKALEGSIKETVNEQFAGCIKRTPVSTECKWDLKGQGKEKPRTKVGYEKVEFEQNEIWKAFKEHQEVGFLYVNTSDGFECLLDGVFNLAMAISQGDQLYRKVERPVEWWEDAVEYIRSLNGEANAIDFTDASSDGKKMAMNISVVLDERQAKDFARILLEQEGE
ncbi:hypothetical protein PP410_gp18 [Vibrio phage NF]|uniref:Uncharacterized protein n=1 Tax=Vibrio phage NF TaxID=2686202 RepID=A0A6B9J1V8_9CAUD|nr:hypothetical protein PP410_gp18 [Vibrio phage NF]QGZ13235.1 hypothetical protein [Vibrio phage NF]